MVPMGCKRTVRRALPSGATAAAVTNTMWAFFTRCTMLRLGVEMAIASPVAWSPRVRSKDRALCQHLESSASAFGLFLIWPHSSDDGHDGDNVCRQCAARQ